MQAGVEWLLQGSLVGCLLSSLDSDETLSFIGPSPCAYQLLLCRTGGRVFLPVGAARHQARQHGV